MRSPKLITRLLASAAIALAASSVSTGALAQTRTTDPSTLDILDVLVDKGVLSREDADDVLAEARRRSEVDAGTVRVPYVPEAVREQIRDEVKKEVVATAKSEGWAQPDALPEWLDRFRFSGDIRVRGEHIGFGSSNVPYSVPDVNAINADGEYYVDDVLPLRAITEDRFRTRVRGRFAIDGRVNDHVEAGVRLVTGNLMDPVSTNESLTGNFDKFTVGLDRAYIRLRPFAKDHRFGGTNLVLGKFDNPFFSTELMFDRDLQFDGAAATLSAAFGGGEDAPRIFLVGGAFPLEEWDFTGNDKYLFGGQIGFAGSPTPGLRLQAAAALYEFSHVQGQFNTQGLRDNDYTAPDRVQFGNTMFNLRQDNGIVNTILFGLASEYRVAALTALAEFDLTPSLVASIEFEGLQNLAFDEQDLLDRSPDPVNFPLVSSGDTAWHARVGIGHRDFSVPNAWMLKAGYRRLEGDSTLDLFTDSDFGVGGTDQKGFVVQGSWALMKNTWLTGSWYSARTINLLDPTTGGIAFPVDVDTFMFDLNANF
ncbi:putative porin [Erythrobacter aureus]|uniref:putative porin n=1 Tax=Erythrobacter aureus TaxID=2182384 RepID=UPI003A904FFD